MAGKSRLPVRDFEFIEIQPLNLDKESEKKPNSPEAPEFSEDSQEEMSEIHLEKEKGKKDVKKTQTKVSTPSKKPNENIKQKSPVKQTPKKNLDLLQESQLVHPFVSIKIIF